MIVFVTVMLLLSVVTNADTAFVPTCGKTTKRGSAFECPESMVYVSSKAGLTKPSKAKCCEDKKDAYENLPQPDTTDRACNTGFLYGSSTSVEGCATECSQQLGCAYFSYGVGPGCRYGTKPKGCSSTEDDSFAYFSSSTVYKLLGPNQAKSIQAAGAAKAAGASKTEVAAAGTAAATAAKAAEDTTTSAAACIEPSDLQFASTCSEGLRTHVAGGGACDGHEAFYCPITCKTCSPELTPGCTGVGTPSGCKVPVCTTSSVLPYDGCTVSACTTTSVLPYEGCKKALCTAANTPYPNCVEAAAKEAKEAGNAAGVAAKGEKKATGATEPLEVCNIETYTHCLGKYNCNECDYYAESGSLSGLPCDSTGMCHDAKGHM